MWRGLLKPLKNFSTVVSITSIIIHFFHKVKKIFWNGSVNYLLKFKFTIDINCSYIKTIFTIFSLIENKIPHYHVKLENIIL